MPHHRTLAIHPAPFKSSHLAIPPSPFSPCSPITPVPKEPRHDDVTVLNISNTSRFTLQAPSAPLQWVWTCHACTRTYPLGATRRCLDDGHHFCAGTTVVKSWRKDGPRRRMKKHRACASEFDFAGWKGWGRWRRGVPTRPGKAVAGKSLRPLMLDTNKEKNCWINCDYPSHCRWGKKVGIHTPTPTQTEFSLPSIDTSMLNTPMSDMLTLDDCFAAEDDLLKESGVGALGRVLEASAKRKSVGTSPTSPLSATFSAQLADPGKGDGTPDVEMLDADHVSSAVPTSFIDPALLVLTDTSYTSPSSAPPTSPLLPTTTKTSATIDKIKSLLSTRRSTSRRQSTFPTISNQRELNRSRRYAIATLEPQEPRDEARDQRKESDALFDDFALLENVARWNEGAVKVV